MKEYGPTYRGGSYLLYADLQTVKTLMRHSRITTTEQYLHDIPENLSEAVEKAARRRQDWNKDEEWEKQKREFHTMNGNLTVVPPKE